MISWLFSRDRQADTIGALYGAIVAQARSPCFYVAYRVPDTVEGRFDMIVLHHALFLSRLRREKGAERALGQRVFDAFCRDMDGNLREMGVSDLAVPKRMRQFAEAFYGRAAAYDAALAQRDHQALVATLTRNIFPDAAEPSEGARRLAAYVRGTVRDLALQPRAALAGGLLQFPDPATTLAREDP